MSSYKQFVFESYKFDKASKTLTLRYGLDDTLHFSETFRFDFDFTADLDEAALQRACELVFLLAGVSYYKTYLPPEIVLENVQVDEVIAKFLQKTYQKGLGEFFFVNNLDPKTVLNFPASDTSPAAIAPKPAEGLLIGIGGGKDSLVTAEMLREQPKVATWSLNHRSQLEPLVQRIGLKHFYVEREWDKQLLELNTQGAYNGHVPISAIFAAVGTVVAILTGYTDVIVSNESSASEPNLTYQGVAINHQYSKSLEFEQDFQKILQHLLNERVRYYSFLRPLTELHVAELFTKSSFEKYQGVFSSCNRAFTHDSDRIFWDGTCPKCAFVFLVQTPFVAREKLEALFGGKNLLLDPELEPTYKQLLGIEGDKPLECVGEIKESRAAMRLSQKQYPELVKYNFELPADYDYQTLSEHRMPAELFELLQSKL